MTGRGPVYFKRPAWPGWGLGKGKKAGHLECVLRLYSTCAALYSACTPLVLRCTPLVLHLCCAVLHLYSAVLRLYSTCAALYSACTPLVLRCTPLVLHLCCAVLHLYSAVLRFPSRSVRAGFDRKVPEIDEAWKQYSRSEKFRIFPVGNGQKSPEKSEDFSTRNTISDSHRFLWVFCRTRWFFLIFPTGSDRFGRPESSTWVVLCLYSTRTSEYWSLAFSLLYRLLQILHRPIHKVDLPILKHHNLKDRLFNQLQ
jgi:hypothetical protein